jgi:hypothetical protein
MNTVKRLVAGSALTGALATYYTVAAATSAIVKEIILCNTDVVARTVDVHFIPPAGTAAVANQILDGSANANLQAGETKMFNLSSVLPTGYFIQAVASSAAVVSMNISGIEVT